MQSQNRLVRTSRIVVKVGIVINRIFFAAVCLAMVLSWIFASQILQYIIRPSSGADPAAELVGLRLEMLIGLVGAGATDRLLTALSRMLASVESGDAFDAANARRLQMIGWSLLVLQLLDICGLVLAKAVPSLGTAAPGGDISVGGWVAVLMVFILARVFAAGAVMREELEGTV